MINLPCADLLKKYPDYTCISDYRYQNIENIQIFIIKKNDKQFLMKVKQTNGKKLEELRENIVQKILTDYDRVLKIEEMWIEG